MGSPNAKKRLATVPKAEEPAAVPRIEEIMARYTPRRQTVHVPLDGEVLAELEELERQVQTGRGVPGLRAQLDALRERAESTAVAFTFTGIPRKRYRDLIAQHQPRPPDPKLRWNLDTFAPALLAACCVEPAMTEAEAVELWGSWGTSVAEVLFAVAITVNEGPLPVVPRWVKDASRG